MKSTVGRFLCLLSLVFFTSCVTKPISQVSTQEGIARLREYAQNKKWEVLIQEAQEFRTRYPYAEYLPEVELMIANARFELKRYDEAIVSYEEFSKKYREHPERAFALFRIAECYFVQSSDDSDRDQNYNRRALGAYGRYIEEYGQGAYVKEARDKISILSRRLAEHEMFVARFYMRKEKWSGAVVRFERVLREWPQFADLTQEARAQAALAYERLANILEKNPQSDIYAEFKNQTPETLRAKAQALRSGANP